MARRKRKNIHIKYAEIFCDTNLIEEIGGEYVDFKIPTEVPIAKYNSGPTNRLNQAQVIRKAFNEKMARRFQNKKIMAITDQIPQDQIRLKLLQAGCDWREVIKEMAERKWTSFDYHELLKNVSTVKGEKQCIKKIKLTKPQNPPHVISALRNFVHARKTDDNIIHEVSIREDRDKEGSLLFNINLIFPSRATFKRDWIRWRDIVLGEDTKKENELLSEIDSEDDSSFFTNSPDEIKTPNRLTSRQKAMRLKKAEKENIEIPKGDINVEWEVPDDLSFETLLALSPDNLSNDLNLFTDSLKEKQSQEGGFSKQQFSPNSTKNSPSLNSPFYTTENNSFLFSNSISQPLDDKKHNYDAIYKRKKSK